VFSVTLIVGAQDRYKPLIREYGISVSDSLSARSPVRLSSPPLAAYGENSSVTERGSWGNISTAGEGQYIFEIHDLENFTEITSEDEILRRVSHESGVYAYWDVFVNGSLAPGKLKFQVGIKTVCSVAVEIRNPEYVVEPKVLLLNFRTLTADEMIKDTRLQNKGSCPISSGRIENVTLEFWLN